MQNLEREPEQGGARRDRQPVRAAARARSERAAEAIQFVVIAMTVTVGTIGIWQLIQEGESKDGARITSCIEESDELLLTRPKPTATPDPNASLGPNC